MKYYSTNRQSPEVSLREAVMRGLAPDGGLYMPGELPSIPKAFFNNISSMSLSDIAFIVADRMLGSDINSSVLRRIVAETFSFDIPLVQIDDNVYSLELFHGPTGAFKDIGARFLARVISHYSGQAPGQKVKVLVATSGDSGAAVAAGFHGVPGIETYILYPSGGLSRAQISALSLPGRSVTPIEVLGTFDDCQRLVKQAFIDSSLRREVAITSANSINIARLLPQMCYFFHGYASLLAHGERQDASPSGSPVVFSIPSGNLGNLTAGLMSMQMGLPVSRFIVANNVNNVTVDYLHEGVLKPRRAIPTVAKAMDVGNPSNITRILDLFAGSHAAITRVVDGYTVSDRDIKGTISLSHLSSGYLLDPHSAAALCALRSRLSPGEKGIFLATAHPAKSARVVAEATGEKVPPVFEPTSRRHNAPPHARISGSYDALRRLIVN